MREDEIQVLGQNAHRERSWFKKNLFVFIALILLAAIGGAFFLYSNGNRRAVLRKVESDVKRTSGLTIQKSDLYQIGTTINGVELLLVHVINMDAIMSTDVSLFNDTTVRVMVAATQKNGKDDIVLNGKVYARGKRHDGFCAIVNGNISIGATKADNVIDYCIEHQGSFFRQELLLRNGEIQQSAKKGKAVRCALAKQGNDVYIAATNGNESLHDFAEAMKDAGVTDAILLDDASLMEYKLDDCIYALDPKKEASGDGACYLFFKVRGDLQQWTLEEEEEQDS
jgi:hypothetical protein